MPPGAQVRLSPEAVADLGRLRRFLLDVNPPAAARMSGVLDQAMARLSANPYIGRPWPFGAVDSGIREFVAPFGRQAYVLRYLTEPGAVTVLRIHHSREDRRREAETP